MFCWIQSTKWGMLVYTPGSDSRAHPMPHETRPIRVDRPSLSMVNGPPESPCKWFGQQSWFKKLAIGFNIYLARVTTALLVTSTGKDIIDSLPPACIFIPFLAITVVNNADVDCLQDVRHCRSTFKSNKKIPVEEKTKTNLKHQEWKDK